MERRTSGNKGLRFNLCVSYGARGDCARAAQRCCEDVAAGRLRARDVDEAAFAEVGTSNSATGRAVL
jgi:undecaprenyl diphosphate synthase